MLVPIIFRIRVASFLYFSLLKDKKKTIDSVDVRILTFT